MAGLECVVYRVDVHRTMNDRFQVMWRQEIGCPPQIAGANASLPTVPITVVSAGHVAGVVLAACSVGVVGAAGEGVLGGGVGGGVEDRVVDGVLLAAS